MENGLKTCYMKYATDKLDGEAYTIASTELKRKKAEIEAELEKYTLDLSNLDSKINAVLVTCSKLGDLWSNGDLEIKRKVQELVFPNGILWDKHIRNYRTENRNEFFDLLDRLSVNYGNKKETLSCDNVPSCAG